MPPGPQVTGKVHQFNPSGYVRYKPVTNMTLYAQISRGFRSGDVNQPLPIQCQADEQAAGLQTITQPDTLTNYELGVKSRSNDGRLSVNADIYKYKWKGVQLTDLLKCGFSGVVNAGDINGQGVELEVLAAPTPAWQFNLALSYNRNRFGSVQAGTGFTEGDRLPDAPEKNGSVGVQYNFPVSERWRGFARGDYVYVGNVLTRPATAIINEGGYGQANARLGFTRERLEVDLYSENLTDKRGISATGDPTFGGYQTIIRPREIGVELRYAF